MADPWYVHACALKAGVHTVLSVWLLEHKHVYRVAAAAVVRAVKPRTLIRQRCRYKSRLSQLFSSPRNARLRVVAGCVFGASRPMFSSHLLL